MRGLGSTSSTPRSVQGPAPEPRADATAAVEAVDRSGSRRAEGSREAVPAAEPWTSSVAWLEQRAALAVAAALIGASLVLGSGGTPTLGAPGRAEAAAVRSLATHDFEVRAARDIGARYRKVTRAERSSVRGLTAVAILPRISYHAATIEAMSPGRLLRREASCCFATSTSKVEHPG
jgi:hypothetical protein